MGFSTAITPTGLHLTGDLGAAALRPAPVSPAPSSPPLLAPTPPAPDLDALARRYGRRLERMAAEALVRVGERPDRHRVEDLVQDVYCRLLASGRPLDPRGWLECQVLAYLRRTVRSAAVDAARIAGAAKRSRPERPDGPPLALRPSGLADPVDPAPTPEQRLLLRDRRRRFLTACRRAAGASPRAARDVRMTALAVLGGWTSREISAALGGRLQPSSVDAAVCRLRGRLATAGLALPRRNAVEAPGRLRAVRAANGRAGRL